MHVAAAKELLFEITKSDIAELQTVTGKAHAAEREHHRIDCWENRKNQNEADRRGDEKGPRMAVDPLAPAVTR